MILAIYTTKVKKRVKKRFFNPDPQKQIALKDNASLVVHWTTLVDADYLGLKEVYIYIYILSL